MSMLPDAGHMDLIDAKCLDIFSTGTSGGAFEIADALMDLDGLPMHCPYHHYLTAAALLTSASLRAGHTEEKLRAMLKNARERAAQVPGGYCGQFGCCGAAVSAGIFASVWQGTAPLSKTGRAAGNELTARALSSIASVDGPRCCKRATYLALRAAIPAARELLGVDVGEFPAVTCRRFRNNQECLGADCPFFPGGPA